MKTDITIRQLYFNPQVAKFFFSEQAYNTFEELVKRVGGNQSEDLFNVLDDRIEDTYDGDLESFEGDCHSLSVDELLEVLGY